MRREPQRSKPGERRERGKIPRVLGYEQLKELYSVRASHPSVFETLHEEWIGTVIRIHDNLEVEITGYIDQGGTANVFEGQLDDGTMVAIKVFEPADRRVLMGEHNAHGAFINPMMEMAILSRLSRNAGEDNPFPQYYGGRFFHEDSEAITYYEKRDRGEEVEGLPPKDKRIGVVVMEKIDGQTLNEKVERLHSDYNLDGVFHDENKQKEHLRVFYRTAKQAIDAIVYAHRENIALIDVKPENFLVMDSGRVRSIDLAGANFISMDTADIHTDAVSIPQEVDNNIHYHPWITKQNTHAFSPGYVQVQVLQEARSEAASMRKANAVRHTDIADAEMLSTIQKTQQHRLQRDRHGVALVLRNMAIGEFRFRFDRKSDAELRAHIEEPFVPLFDISTRLLSDDPEQGITLEQASQEIEALLAAA